MKAAPGPALTQRRERLTLTIAEAADELGVSETKVREWVRAAKLPALQLGGRGGKILIPRAGLERLLEGAALAK